MTALIQDYGYLILFLIVAAESSGIPVPGETALVTAGVLASQGHLEIEWVIVVAAAAAIIGDNIGYWIGRKGGTKLLARWAWTRRMRDKYMPPAQKFFNAHGGKTIFFARFVAVLRVFGAWIAGITHMPWWRFLAWNAAGGICWATLVGLVAYFVGDAAAKAIGTYSLVGGVVAAILAVAGFFVVRRLERRVVGEE